MMAPDVTLTNVKNVNANETKPTIIDAVLIFEPINAALSLVSNSLVRRKISSPSERAGSSKY